MFAPPPRRPWTAAAALVALAALAALAVADIQPPAPRPAGAPTGEFAAGRAFTHVQEISRETHVAGSPAADRVREYIVRTLTGYGLTPQVQDTTGLSAGRRGDESGAARVRNVIARVPGSASTGRLIIVAHYDSAQVSFGANDDGAGVSTMLEVARIVAGSGPPRNEVVFLFTDAEEAGLIGAEAFVSLHPLGRDRAVVLNIEARGSSGPVVMFETSRGNAALVDVFARTPHPVGSSVAVEIYRILRNDTDFTPFLVQERFTGLNSAYIDGAYAYHSPRDTAAHLSQASLQQHGDNALALVRAFGRADLGPLTRPAEGDATYFPLPGFLARYPQWLVWPLALLALMAVGALAALARRRGLTSWPRVAAGCGLALVPLVLAAVAAQLLYLVLVAVHPGYAVLVDPARPGWYRVGLLALAAAVLLGWYAVVRRRIGPVPLAIGGYGLLAVLGVLFAALIPGGAYLVTLPALAGAGALVGALYARPWWARLALRAAGPVLTVLVLAPMIFLFLPALGLGTGGASAVFAVLLGLGLLPLLDLLWPPVDARPAAGPPAADEDPAAGDDPAADEDPAAGDDPALVGRGRRWAPAAAPALALLAVAVLATGAGLVVERDSPEATHLMYALDQDSGTARWVSGERTPGSWTARYVDRSADLSREFPLLGKEKLSVGAATATALTAPQVRVESDTATATGRVLRLRVLPTRAVRLVAVYAEVGSKRITRADANGRNLPLFLESVRRFGLEFHAVPAEGFALNLEVTGSEPVRLRVLDGSDGLDGLPGFGGRPAGVTIAGSHSAELVCVARTVTV